MGVVALLAPLVLAYMSQGVKAMLGMQRETGEELTAFCLSTYPVYMFLVAIGAGAVFAKKTMDKWRDSVRDEIYLVGEVLHNLDEGER